jgi:hypothetical protein
MGRGDAQGSVRGGRRLRSGLARLIMSIRASGQPVSARPSWTESIFLTTRLFGATNIAVDACRGLDGFAHPAFKRTCSTEEL